jgi:hypothetical protein
MSIEEVMINNEFAFDLHNMNGVPFIQGCVTQDYVDWAKDGSFYLSTMPRSGTNFLTYFFNYYHMALKDELDFDNPIPVEIVKGAWNGFMESTLGFKWFLVSHNFCPGFESLCDGNFRENWNNIVKSKYDNNDMNYIFLIDKFRNILYPNLNKKVKIIFVFRNPLDQIISLSKHYENHITPIPNSDLKSEESIMYMINQYIKMYLTYDYMKKLYPENIKFISYEELSSNPRKIIEDILEYYNFDLSISNRLKTFDNVLDIVTPKALRELELRTGKTLANDQKLSSSKESHMRGGKVGKWIEFFSKEDLYLIEKRFNEFGLTLNSFDGIEYDFKLKG